MKSGLGPQQGSSAHVGGGGLGSLPKRGNDEESSLWPCVYADAERIK